MKITFADDPYYVEDDLKKPTNNGTYSALVITNRLCMSNNFLLKVQRNGGIVDMEICYDKNDLKTIYVKYEIDGVSLENFKTVIVPPQATVNVLLYPKNIACYYTKVMTHYSGIKG